MEVAQVRLIVRRQGKAASKETEYSHLASFLRAISRKLLMSVICLGCETGA